jgi:dihydrofolate reductase
LRKVIWSILVTVDGFIDHTAMIADQETHQYYADELDTVDTVIYGRVTYQLLADYWPTAAMDASLNPGELAFAQKMNRVSKIVFSKTLDRVAWENTQLNKGDVVEQVAKLKRESGRDISIGGGAIANTLMRHDLIDEYRFLINPIVLGTGTRLVRNGMQANLKLIETRSFSSGCVLLAYQPVRKPA